MRGKSFFISGDKSFEINEDNDGLVRWFVWIERGHRFTSQIKIDEENLKWVCEQMQRASRNYGNIYRRWGRKIQGYLYRVYQNYNNYGRYLRIETWLGDRKKAIIIPEAGYNLGWGDIAKKIEQFLGKASNHKFRIITDLQNKSFLKTAAITQWPSQQEKVISSGKASIECSNFLAKCLIGCFSDPFSCSPNPEVIQKWFLKRWQVTAGLKITPLAHNKFLFELPSIQEAARIKAGEWYWNGRHLSLEWWSPKGGSDSMKNVAGQKWVKASGVPLHGWTVNSFRYIGDLCGGYIGIDEDTKNRSHFFWARICVQCKSVDLPKELEIVVDGLRYKVSILEDQITEILCAAVTKTVLKKVQNVLPSVVEMPQNALPVMVEKGQNVLPATAIPTIASTSNSNGAGKNLLVDNQPLCKQCRFTSNTINETLNKEDNLPSYQRQKANYGKGGKVAKNLGQNLDRSYYARGPKSRPKSKFKSARQKWLPLGLSYYPCLKRNSPLLQSNRFDPLSVEIEAEEEYGTEQQLVQNPFEADDEEETQGMPIQRLRLLKQFEEITSTAGDISSSDTLSLPWYGMGYSDPQVISSSPTVIDTSRWTKSVMLKACKVFGVNVVGFEHEIFAMVLRMEQKRLEQSQRQKTTLKTSSKGKNKQTLELERLKWGMNSEGKKTGERGRFYKAFSG